MFQSKLQLTDFTHIDRLEYCNPTLSNCRNSKPQCQADFAGNRRQL